MITRFLAAGGALALGAGVVRGSTLVVDSFTEGGHFLFIDPGGRLTHPAAVTSAFGSIRVARLSQWHVIPGTTMSSTLSAVIGTLDFAVGGESINGRPLDLRVTYSGGGPFSLEGYSALEFDFSAATGEGYLIVGLGSGSDFYGPEAKRIPVNEPGTIQVPFSELNFGATGSIESFYAMRFIFESASEAYSFTLDEIRVVPEPSGVLLMALGAAALLGTRHRSAKRRLL